MRKDYYGLYVLMIPFAIALIAIFVLVLRKPATAQAVGRADPARGIQRIIDFGCGACHVIGGVSGANGTVGPPLNGFSEHVYIVGKLQNTPANLVQWIRFPQEVNPGVDMPDLGVTEAAARDIAAYLYTLK